MGMNRYDNLYPTNLDPATIINSGSFDELEIPPEFHGTFGELFQYLLTCYGSIAVGLFRYSLFLLISRDTLDFLKVNPAMLQFCLHRVPL